MSLLKLLNFLTPDKDEIFVYGCFLGLRLRNYFLSVADCILTRDH